MTINQYFQSGLGIGRSSEQLVHEDLIIECLKIYGFEVFYLPRSSVNLDTILNEDVLNKYNQAYSLEMYLSDVEGFTGEGQVEGSDTFFQLGKLYVFSLNCELYQYSGEEISTGNFDVDTTERALSLDVKNYNLKMEDGSNLLYEYNTNATITLESFNVESITPLAQNEDFQTEAVGILDFSEQNPFGEY